MVDLEWMIYQSIVFCYTNSTSAFVLRKIGLVVLEDLLGQKEKINSDKAR